MGILSYQFTEYQFENGDDILEAIGEDPNWELFTKSQKEKEKYKNLLNQSPTLVCYLENELCGYLRAVLDGNFAIYISEIFVKPEHRNNKIAQHLIEKLKEKFKELRLYALSDEDLFYEKRVILKQAQFLKYKNG